MESSNCPLLALQFCLTIKRYIRLSTNTTPPLLPLPPRLSTNTALTLRYNQNFHTPTLPLSISPKIVSQIHIPSNIVDLAPHEGGMWKYLASPPKLIISRTVPRATFFSPPPCPCWPLSLEITVLWFSGQLYITQFTIYIQKWTQTPPPNH